MESPVQHSQAAGVGRGELGRGSLRLFPVKTWLISREKSGDILPVSFLVPDLSFPPVPSAKLLTGEMWFIFEKFPFSFFFIGAATRV